MVSPATQEKMVNLLDPGDNLLFNMSLDEAIERVGSGDADRVREIDGQYALVSKRGTTVRMARSIGRPMRFFLAKQQEGPLLVIAERIDELHGFLQQEGLDDQFHPSYTRMIPAHHITELALLGCPDPNPTYTRFLASRRDTLDTDLDRIGEVYMGAVAQEIGRWLDHIDAREPIGVLFSGGIDSGAILLLTYHLLLRRGESPARLKAFTLSVENLGEDSSQAADFLKQVGLEIFLEPIEVSARDLDYRKTIRTIEDYKPLDVQSATMALALCEGIRRRYPDWTHLLDGDGGDENLRDYPIEENPELTIHSVLNNPFFYQEGWGVDAVKHSLTYSGGQSRGHVRTYAPAAQLGFVGFSPFATPNVVQTAEGIPFVELTNWQHDKLYALKGEVTRRGVEAITGIRMPVHEKRRFQEGAVDESTFAGLFPTDAGAFRRAFAEIYG
ncbi:MAG: asparagine synthetase B family protein [Planctomycetes bacterium]|nr:asparagine synthetase B family protein [Planctomycetota bacterium]